MNPETCTSSAGAERRFEAYALSRSLYLLEQSVRKRAEIPVGRHHDLIYLASFPKSGNSWVRFVLANASMILGGHDTDVTFQTVDRYSPVPRHNPSLDGCLRSPGFPLVAKTHWAYVPEFADNPRILLVRHPADALYSFYRYLRAERRRHLRSDMSQFLRCWRHGASAWANYHQAWHRRENALVRYEDLLRDPVNVLSAALSSVGYPVPDNVLQEAVRRSSKEQMRRIRTEFGDPHAGPDGYQFVGKGVPGDGLRNLHARDLGYIAKMTLPAVEQLGLGYEF